MSEARAEKKQIHFPNELCLETLNTFSSCCPEPLNQDFLSGVGRWHWLFHWTTDCPCLCHYDGSNENEISMVTTCRYSHHQKTSAGTFPVLLRYFHAEWILGWNQPSCDVRLLCLFPFSDTCVLLGAKWDILKLWVKHGQLKLPLSCVGITRGRGQLQYSALFHCKNLTARDFHNWTLKIFMRSLIQGSSFPCIWQITKKATAGQTVSFSLASD